MKSRELERLNRTLLLPHLPGWAAKGTLLFATPIGDLLRALDFEPSGFERDVRRVRYFVLPLYVRDRTHVHFGFARVLGGVQGGIGDHWFDFPVAGRAQVMGEIADLVKTEALPWLDRLQTPADLARHGADIHRNDRNTHVVAELAYSHVLAGQYDAARAQLLNVLGQVAAEPEPGEPLLATAEAAELVRHDLDVDPARAVQRLRGWRSEALKALGLTKWAAELPAG